MNSLRPGTIISLNYHEVSADPRVLKQARALAANGYRVHVYCDSAKDLPAEDIIGDVQVTRFPCFSNASIDPSDADLFDFLDASGPFLLERFLPYAQACARSRQISEALQKTSPTLSKKLKTDYYKDASGFKRYRRKFAHLWAKASLTWSKELRDAGVPDIVGMRTEAKLLRVTRKALFQSLSLVFASNLLRQKLPADACAIHAHDIYCLPGGALLARKFGVPLIYDAHEYEPARATKMALTGPNLAELLERDCFPFISRIITVSDSIAELYKERFSGVAPTVIANAPEIGLLSQANEEDAARVSIRRQAGLSEGAPVVVFTGGVQRAHRGLDVVLEALTLLPGTFLVCLGPRRLADDTWLLELAHKLGVQDRVKLLPSVEAHLVPLAIRSADVAICPIQDVSLSYRYSMPNKLFEAVFARVPICVSDLPDMRRFVESLGVGIAMDQTSSDSVAKAIAYVLANKEQFAMTPEAEERLETQYSWNAHVKRLLALYDELLAASPQTEDSPAAEHSVA